jgi:hypothetical protein
MVYDDTMPSSHRTSRITKIVQSIPASPEVLNPWRSFGLAYPIGRRI